MMINAPSNVLEAGISPKSKNPTVAENMSSVYRNGANALASTMLNDLSKQYNNPFAPAPRSANNPYCDIVGATQDVSAGYAVMHVVKKAV